MKALVVATVAALLVASSSAQAGHARVVRGVVKEVADERAYLEHGAADGLALGARVSLGDGKSCEVDRLADTSASCLGTRLAPGMRYSFTVEPLPSRDAAAGPSPTGTGADAHVRDRLAAAPFPLLVAKPAPHTAARAHALVEAGVLSSTTVGVLDASYVQPFVELQADAPLWLPGLSGGLWLRASSDVVAPKTRRFRPGELAQLDVFRASAVYESAALRVEAGRLFPEAPGAPILDGAQASYALTPSLRLGVDAGAVPTLDALVPSLAEVRADAFASWHAIGGGPLDLVVDGRAGTAAAPSSGAARVDGEVRAAGRFGAAASAFVDVAGGAGSAGAFVERVSAQGIVTPVPSLHLAGGYRYSGEAQTDFDAAVAGWFPSTAHDASLDVDWDALPFFTVGARGGAFAALDAVPLRANAGGDVVRGYAGPAAVLSLAPASTRVSAAWLEELGAFGGRTVTLDVDYSPVAGVVVRNGAAYFETRYGQSDAVRELGLDVDLSWSPLPWLSFTGRAWGQQALPALDPTPQQTPFSLLTDVAVAARF